MDLSDYIVTKDRRAVFCRCEVCDKGCHYTIAQVMAASEHSSPLQCPNCQSYAVHPQRRQEK